MAKQTTGEFLATLRKAHGYKQSEVAEKLNISDRTLSSWETDRTLPDLLLLPTIADLYGVSVDEILRGERTTKTEPNKISEQALLSSRKNHWGKFLAQSTLIYGIAIIGTFVLLLTSVILPYTASPLWLNILMGILGGICIAVCMVLMFYSEYKLRIREGIILKEDFTPENKALLLSAKRKITNLPLIISLILFFVIFVLLMELLFLWRYLLPFILLIVYGVTCFSLLIFAIIFGRINISTYGTEEQINVLKANGKFARKIYCICIIPVFLVLALLFILWLTLSSSTTAYYESEEFIEFRNHTQTLTLLEDSTEVVHYDYKAGEYQLDFPEKPQEDVYYKLNDNGNGIYGKMTSIKNAWQLYYKYQDEYDYISTVLIMQLNGNYFVNVRYEYYYNFYLSYGNSYYSYPDGKYTIDDNIWIGYQIYEHFKYVDGKYGFYCDFYRDYNFLYMIIDVFSICSAYSVTTIVYFAKRKKIQYEY